MHRDIRSELQAGRIGRDRAALTSGAMSLTLSALTKPSACAFPPKSTSPPRVPSTAPAGSRLRLHGRRRVHRVHRHHLLPAPTFAHLFRPRLLECLAPSRHDLHFAHLPIGQINPKTASFQAAPMCNL